MLILSCFCFGYAWSCVNLFAFLFFQPPLLSSALMSLPPARRSSLNAANVTTASAKRSLVEVSEWITGGGVIGIGQQAKD